MKKFEGLWVNALVSAAAPLAKDSVFHQSQNQSVKNSAKQTESVKLSHEADAATA